MECDPRMVVTKWRQETASGPPVVVEYKFWFDALATVRPHWITVVVCVEG